jgi:endonuclease YncB( thermonuclease family)
VLPRLGRAPRTVPSWQVHAVDGDTIRYGNERIRIRGLDAPELSESGGPEARQRLADLLRSGTISVIPHGQDVYGRTVADVFVNGQNVSEILVSEGYGRRG